MGDLCVDTSIEGGGGSYRAHLSRDWEIWGPNGGYLAVIALRAAGAESRFQRPVSFACHYLSVARFDRVEIEVTAMRRAKRAESLRVVMMQDDRTVLEAMVWTADPGEGLEHEDAPMPQVPDPEALPSLDELMGGSERSPHRFWANIEMLPIDWEPPANRHPRSPHLHRWLRFRPRATFDDAFVEAGRSLLVVDTMLWPAATMPHPGDERFLAPSLDVSVQFHRGAPESEWLLCDAAAPVATQGVIAGRAQVWSRDGRILASGGGQMLCRRVR